MEFIVAVDQNWGIGRAGGMLDHLPKDLAFYKQTTTGHVIVMGRKTLESFPGGRPLPNRLHVVLTRDRDYVAPEGVLLAHSLEALADTLAALGREDVFLVGGGSLYASLLDHCRGGYVTHIDHAYEAVDTYFPDLSSHTNWQLAETIRTITDHGRALRFCYYTNTSVQPWGGERS